MIAELSHENKTNLSIFAKMFTVHYDRTVKCVWGVGLHLAPPTPLSSLCRAYMNKSCLIEYNQSQPTGVSANITLLLACESMAPFYPAVRVVQYGWYRRRKLPASQNKKHPINIIYSCVDSNTVYLVHVEEKCYIIQ